MNLFYVWEAHTAEEVTIMKVQYKILQGTTHLKYWKGHMLTGKMNCQPVFSPAGLIGDTASSENPVVLLPENLICHREDAL